jgi:hypothetical protein
MKDLLDLHRESRLELPSGAARPSRGLWLGAAAAILLAALAVPLLQMRTERSSGAPSSPRGEATAQDSVTPPDRAVLASPPERLAWAEVAGAEAYETVLYDDESTPIWSGPVVRATEVEIPEAVRAGLRPGSDYYWRVTAIVGIERRSSALHRFHLAP